MAMIPFEALHASSPEVVVEMVRAVSGGPCMLCGRNTRGVGIFYPEDSPTWGAPEGKQRMFIYSYCGCRQHDERAWKAIEDTIQNQLAALFN